MPPAISRSLANAATILGYSSAHLWMVRPDTSIFFPSFMVPAASLGSMFLATSLMAYRITSPG